MKGFKFSGLYQKDGWISPAFITVDDAGKIVSIGKTALDFMNYEEVKGLALPAFPNAHSHAFQYAMAGLAEVHSAGSTASDFWAWRNKMYEIALTVDPDDMQHIATMVYSEMVRHGYSEIVEFHYLHHDKNGKPYYNIAEMGERLIAAAFTAGINITLVPMLYQKGGFNKAPEDHQRRFISSTEQYLNLVEACKTAAEKFNHSRIGFGAHSLRAAGKESLAEILNAFGNEYPFHIHVAEQLKEVIEAEEFLKSRPIEWLLNNFDVNDNFHLIHATHLSDSEISGITQTGANVVLCPSTEGNLGDGIFPLNKYIENNGRWCIGTDSHIGLNPLEELRLLDYGQRLTTHKRNTFSPAGGDGAGYALDQAITNGRKAAGKEVTGYFEVGNALNAVVVDNYHPLLNSDPEYWLSTIVYHFNESNFSGTIINGKWQVKGGFHLQQLSVRDAFRKTLDKLKIRKR